MWEKKEKVYLWKRKEDFEVENETRDISCEWEEVHEVFTILSFEVLSGFS